MWIKKKIDFKILFGILFCGFALFFINTGYAYAATIYSNYSTGSDSTGDGTSGTPYKTFNKAYTMASSGDTLDLTGTFTWTNADETGDASTTGYTIAKDLTIQGHGTTQTIIQSTSSDNTADRRVFTIPVANTVTINDVTIRYGKVGSSQNGGGLLIHGIAAINRADISYNRSTDGQGGGVDVRGKLTIQNSTIHHNVASYAGGGLNRDYYSGSGGVPAATDVMDVINCTIANNQVTQTVAYLEGGGIFYRRGEGSITNSTITLNQVVNGGSSRSTHGLGTGDGAGTIKLKNNIIAGNILSDNGGDIGHRENGYGVYTDNGGNIIGRRGYYSGGFTPSVTTWMDATSYSTAIDGTYVLQDGGSTSGTLNLDTALGINDNQTNGEMTVSITSGSSIAINNATAGLNGTIAVPELDQRGFARNGDTDIGAFEYNASYSFDPPTTQASSIAFSTIKYNRMTVSWTNGNGSRRTVFMKQANSGTASPVDGTSYTANSAFGSGTQIATSGWYAIYEGLGTTVTVTNLTPATNYIVQIFEYNGVTQGREDYFTDTASNNPNTTPTYTPVTLYCNYTTGNDTTGNGTSGNPYKTFNKCYTMSDDGDTIDLTGTFTWTNADETGDASTTGYTIGKDLTIQGHGTAQTIVQAASSDNTADRRVFTLSLGNTVAINNMTIRYGKVGSSQNGGGLLIHGIAAINRADISYNRSTDGQGGGVDVRGKLTIQNSTIHHNVASYAGGGLNRDYYSGSGGVPAATDVLDVINCTVANNQVTQTVAYLEGGGVFYRRGEGSITNSTISLNQVTNGGSSKSTHGLGTGDGAGTIKLKNNIIAGNILSSYGGDIGHRENGYGVYTDNGGNIIGRRGYYSGGFTPAATTWMDATSYSTAIDGTYRLQNGGSTDGTLSLSGALSTNGNPTGTTTLSITSGSSIAVNNATEGTNGSSKKWFE